MRITGQCASFAENDLATAILSIFHLSLSVVDNLNRGVGSLCMILLPKPFLVVLLFRDPGSGCRCCVLIPSGVEEERSHMSVSLSTLMSSPTAWILLPGSIQPRPHQRRAPFKGTFLQLQSRLARAIYQQTEPGADQMSPMCMTIWCLDGWMVLRGFSCRCSDFCKQYGGRPLRGLNPKCSRNPFERRVINQLQNSKPLCLECCQIRP